MSFIEKNLLKNENVIASARVHWSIYSGTAVLAFIWFLFIINGADPVFITFFTLLPITSFIDNKIRRSSTELALTNKRVIAKYGFISRTTIEIFLEKLDSITVSQGVFDRLFDCGTVVIRGSGLSTAPLKGIEGPINFRNQVNKMVEDLKDKK